MQRRPVEPSAPRRTRRVLVVDDDADMVLSLTTLLRVMGHEATGVTKAADALDAARYFRADIVFLDLGMPDVDGYALAGIFRTTPHVSGVTLVAVSGHGLPVERARARVAGFDAHVLKPIDPPLIESILAQFQVNQN